MITRRLIAMASLVLLTVSASSVSTMLTPPNSPLAFDSGNNSELVTTLPVTKTGTPDIDLVVFCVDIGTAPPPGTVIWASAEVEVTSDIVGYPPLVAGQVILADSCTATDGTEISESNGENCMSNLQHHCVGNKSGVYIVTAATTKHFVSLVMHSLSGSVRWVLGDFVKVESDYGRLSVLVFLGTP